MKIKVIIVVLFLSIKGGIVFSQKIINNVFFRDIDEVNNVDTLLPKYKLFNIELYGCEDLKESQKSCILYSKLKYDEFGRLVELIKGDNLTENKVDYIVQYRKLSDSLFETIARFPPNSTMIPDELFVDTVVRGKPQKYCLYKKDEDHNIVVRSLYKSGTDGFDLFELSDIKRFDLDNKLIQVYYPTGSRRPKKEWRDTVINEYSTGIYYNAVYAENYFKTINTYNKSNQLIETTTLNSSFENGTTDLTKQMIIYDNGKPIIRVTVDINNQIISQERYQYNISNGILIRYTRDNDLTDSLFNEEIHYDNLGRIIYSESRPAYSNNTTTWKYYYDERGLKIKDEYYFNGKFQSKRKYDY